LARSDSFRGRFYDLERAVAFGNITYAAASTPAARAAPDPDNSGSPEAATTRNPDNRKQS
jgi:hypothetical protein